MRSPEESLGRWVSILHRRMQAYIARELAPYEVGKGQHQFLARLFQEDGVSQKDLAEFLQMDKGSVAHALRRLEQNGYIAREKDVGDQRISRVYLTGKAKHMRATFFAVLSSQTDVLAEGFTDEERHQALALLKRMAENAARALKAKADIGA